MIRVLNPLLLIVCFVSTILILHSQDVPRVISYQGVLIDAQGKPITGIKTLSFTVEPVKGRHVGWSETIPDVSVTGGLFAVALGLQHSFPTLEGQYKLRVSEGDKELGVIPLYSAASALNIPDSVVTGKKIAPMGAKKGDVLEFNGDTWVPGVGVPIGTVVAYFGETAPNGWLSCDGQTIPDSCEGLKTVLGKTTTPDLRGYFLRGYKSPPGRDETEERSIGSVQGYSTGKPTKVAFSTIEAGSHSHRQLVYTHKIIGVITNSESKVSVPEYCDDVDNNPGKCMDYFDQRVESVGSHNHVITGGDVETRPRNVAVHYIIKAR